VKIQSHLTTSFMKKQFLLLCLVLSSTLVFSINPVSAYKDLKKGKKDKAFEAFLKISENDSSSLIANYALALLYSDSHFSQYNLELSYKYSQKANKRIKYYSWNRQITQIELKDIEKADIKPIQVSQLKDSIISSIYDNLLKKKTINGFKQFVKDYPDAKEKEEATQYIYTLAWANTIQKLDDICGYEQFIKEYPGAKQVESAKYVLDNLNFKETKKKNTIEAYEQFINKYPNSRQIQEAKQNISGLAFNLAKEKNTIKAYQQFIDSYPETKYINDAKDKIAELIFEQTRKNSTQITSNSETGTFTDPRDGQTYKIIKIGDQWWFAENLKYNIPGIAYVNSYAPYNQQNNNYKQYGNLYIKNRITTADNYGVCPPGWHLPALFEWKALVENLGGTETALKKLKESNGFNLLFGGFWVPYKKLFSFEGLIGSYMTSNKDYTYQFSVNGEIKSYHSADVDNTGNSIRCVKNPDKSYSKKPVFGKMTDIDGNVYRTVKIGNQTWMAENLKTTRFRNGDLIGTTTYTKNGYRFNNERFIYQWASGNNEKNVSIYGRLYTGYVATDLRQVAPEGWHIPTIAELRELSKYLIMNGYNNPESNEYRYYAKSLASNNNWLLYTYDDKPINGVGYDLLINNSTGFCAEPSGYRDDVGDFSMIGTDFYMWTQTDYGTSEKSGYALIIRSNSTEVHFDGYGMKEGLSIRCIKDY